MRKCRKMWMKIEGRRKEEERERISVSKKAREKKRKSNKKELK